MSVFKIITTTIKMSGIDCFLNRGILDIYYMKTQFIHDSALLISAIFDTPIARFLSFRQFN